MKGNLLTLGLQFLPELWMTLTGGIPELVLIAEFNGENDEEIGKRIAATRQAVEQKFGLKTHISKTPQETAKYWTIRRESFNLLRQHSKGKQTAPFIDDFIVHPSQLPEFLPRLNKIFNAYPHLVYTIAGHAGDANFHVIPIMDLSLEENHQIIIQMSHQVYDLVLEYGGSITAEHNDGLIRTPYLEKMYGSNITGLFKAVKEIFDPLYIFNPGKKVGATEQYIIDHIKRG
jgi:FAD/FMN-containing dehydrogenase